MKSADLVKAIDLFKIQGFQTPEEMFLVGYLMAHGGELYLLSLWGHDLALLEHDSQFWLPHIIDTHKIWEEVSKEEVETAKSILKTFLQTRNAKIPEWLNK